MRTKVKFKQLLSISLIALFALSASVFSVLPINNHEVSALSASDWDASYIIDDTLFYRQPSMSVSQIQSFLNSKVTNCASGHTCLKDYKQDTTAKSDSGLCSAIPSRSNRSAAQIIHEVSQACNIDVKVIIVKLQKEQSLVTRTNPTSHTYERAMGYYCPDDPNNPGWCHPAYAGFFNQVYNAARQLQNYRQNPNSFNFAVGRRSFVSYQANAPSCGGTWITMRNAATAGLYNYTPYQPNQAALNNMWGTGDSCSAYGNRNFWRTYTFWFGSTKGTPLFRIDNTAPVYILGSNNNYYHLHSNEQLRAYGYPISVPKIASMSSSYISGKTASGSLPLTARFEDAAVFLMDRGERHHFASSELMEQFGHSLGQEATLPAAYVSYFPRTENMQPIVKEYAGAGIYIMEAGKKRHFVDIDAFHSGDPPYSTRPYLRLSLDYIRSRQTGYPMIAANKLIYLIDSNSYAFWDGLSLQKITNSTVSELGLSTDYKLNLSHIDNLTEYPSTANKLVKNQSDTLYLLDTRKKLEIPASDLDKYDFLASEFLLIPPTLLNRIPTTPMSQLISINGDHSLFYVNNGERLHFNDLPAIGEYGLALHNAVSINTRSAQFFPNSGKSIVSTSTLFRIDNGSAVYIVNLPNSILHVGSKEIMDQYGYSMDAVLNFSQQAVSDYSQAGSLSQVAKDVADNVWITHSGGNRHHIPSSLLAADRFNINPSSLNALSRRVYLPMNSNGPMKNLLAAHNDPKVYYVENGHKRWINSVQTMNNMGYTYDDVSVVNSSFINSIPSGSNITN